jgi:PAS domain S-box-containing protein
MKLLRVLKPYVYAALVIGLLLSLQFIVPEYSTLAASFIFFAAIILIPIYLGFGPAMFFMLACMFIYVYFYTKPGYTLMIGWQRFLRLMVAIVQFSIIIFLAYRFRVFRKMKKTSDKRFRSLVESSKNAVILMNADGKKTYASPAVENILGYNIEEFLAIPSFNSEYHVETDAEKTFKWALAHPGESVTLIHQFKHKNGHYVILETTLTNLLEEPEVSSVVLNVRDLTKEKTAEESAVIQKNRLEIINSIGRSISAELELQPILQTVTDATTKLSGAQFGAFFYNAIDEKGESYMLYTLSGADRSQFDKFGMPRNTAVFHETFSGSSIVRVDDIKKDPRYGKSEPHFGMPRGHLPVTSYMAVPVKTKNGEVIGGLFYGHELPGVFTADAEEIVSGVASQAAIAIDNARLFEEQKKLIEENERLLQLAADVNEKKDEFISIASHELKTPLTTTKAYVQLLQREFADLNDKRLLDYINKTVNNVNKLQTLVEDLLNISKIQAGKLEYNMRDASIMHIVSEAVDNITGPGATHAVRIEGDTNAFVYADAQRIEQVVSNLLSNAMKYSPGEHEVVLSVNDEPTQVVISVKDKGIGIHEADKEKVFNRFERLDNDHRFSGLGIGLYLANEIVKRHNGDMWLDSQVGKGSTFYFSLPKSEPII